MSIDCWSDERRNAGKDESSELHATTPALSMLGGNWWGRLLRGVAAVLFGLVALFWPGLTLFVLIVLFGVYALADGVLAILGGIRESEGRKGFGGTPVAASGRGYARHAGRTRRSFLAWGWALFSRVSAWWTGRGADARSCGGGRMRTPES